MVTMLDCIRRVAPLTREIVKNAEVNTDPVVRELGDDINKINEIIICGAGSSNTAAVTAAGFMEKVTGLQVHTFMANKFNGKSVYNPDALYIFVSQTGTSTLVKEMVVRMNEKGCHTIAVTEDENTPVSKAARTHVDMGCGYEEYWFRTIGYCTSVLTLMIIALRIALERGTIGSAKYNEYLQEAIKAAENHPAVVDKAVKWFEAHQDQLVKGRSFIIYGSGPLHGVALEGALKILETAKHFLAIGYEAEDGLHGPNLGFMKDDIVISMCDGDNDINYSRNVVRFAKNELLAGYSVGDATIDDDDLQFKCGSRYFRAIEFAAVVEIIAYQMAVINDVPVQDLKHRVPHVSTKYFVTHRG